MATGVGTGTGAARRRAKRAQREAVQAMLDLQAAQVEALTRAEVLALRPVLIQARTQLLAELGPWMRGLTAGGTFDLQVMRNAMAMVDRALARIDDTLEAGAAQAVARVGARVMPMSAADLNDQLAIFASVFDGSVHPVSLGEAAIVAHGERVLFPRFRTSAARYMGEVGDDIRKQIALGFARNETFAQMTRRLVNQGGPRGMVALRGVVGEPGAYVEDVGRGLFAKYEKWAERLVRTEGINAYNTIHERGLREAALDDPELKQRWDASADRRLCPVCRELDGKVVDIGKPFPGGFRFPPAHPHCRCTVVPWKVAWGLHEVPSTIVPEPEPRQPRGFDWRAQVDGRALFTSAPAVKRGIPTYKDVAARGHETMYVVRPSDLVDRDLSGIVLPGARAQRIASVKDAWAKGEGLAPIEIQMDRAGRMFIADGNHRLQAAAEVGDAPVAVRFFAASGRVSGDDVQRDLRKALGR